MTEIVAFRHACNVISRHSECSSARSEQSCLHDASPGESAEELDNRSLEEILTSIPPPPPPAMSSEPGAPRLMITHIVNRNFKSYAGEQILGPFHKVSAARLLHVFESKIIDKEGDDYDVIPNSSFYVSRTAAKDNSSSYHINGKKATFKDGEVEQIAMMKSKGQTEHDEGMLEYLEDIIGSCRLKEPINTLCRRVELLNEQRGEKEDKEVREYCVLVLQDEQELEQISEQDQQKRMQVGDMRQKVAEAKSSLSSNRSRNKVLDSLMQQKRSGKIPGILGRLGDLGAVDEKYDVAVSSSCGSLDNILVDTIDTAQRCVTFLKTQNIGVATFIGLDKMKVWQQSMGSVSTPESIPRLFDMVRVKDESVRPAFYFALRDTLVARDLEQATRVAFQKDKRWRVVTLQGQIIEQAGTMTGGGGRVMKGRMGSSVCADVTQEQLDKMESELNKELTQLQDWQQRKHQLEEKVHKARRELRDMKNTLEKYTATIQSLTEQELHLKTQIKDLEANVISAAPDKAKQKQMEKSLEVYRKDFEAASTKAGKVEAEVKRLHTLIVDINSHKLKAQQDKLDQISTQLDECSSAITKAQVAIKTAGRNLKKSEDSVSQLEKEMGENEKLMEELTEQLKKLEEAAGEIMQTYQQEALPEVQEQQRGVLQQIKALQEQEHVLQKESLSVRLKVEHIDTAITECHNKSKWKKNEFWTHKPDLKRVYGPSLAILVTAWCVLCVPSVRPPKKSWKKIYNLSGGEKTLSSLALVFALHHFKPTPLYFMDEIDAALDFKNVSIVACYIYSNMSNIYSVFLQSVLLQLKQESASYRTLRPTRGTSAFAFNKNTAAKTTRLI
uniref:Structural maintenance of chromosomes protein 4-like n=1 Tax=Sinocyclocheilus grahami TaxID=75366 RepID=A0A672M857_SINGR